MLWRLPKTAALAGVVHNGPGFTFLDASPARRAAQQWHGEESRSGARSPGQPESDLRPFHEAHAGEKVSRSANPGGALAMTITQARSTTEQHRSSTDRVKRIGVGLSFIVFPLIWVFAFAVHPDLLDPRILSAEELIERAHGNGLLQFAHALVTLNTAVLVVLTLHFKKLLDRTPYALAGLVGAALAVVGACMLAADKGALCLTMSALDTLPESEFAQMMPGLLAMFSFKGWMVLVWGLVLMPIGVLIQTVAMMRARLLPKWQLWLLFAGVLFIGFPDGAEIINLTAARRRCRSSTLLSSRRKGRSTRLAH